MQCNEVIRELAAPSDDRDSAALAEHLAGCAACSAWAKRASQFDRLWEATRTPEPAPQAWEPVWARIVEALGSSTPIHAEHPVAIAASPNGSTPKLVPSAAQPFPSSRARPRSFVAAALFGLAQAAAILLVVSYLRQSFPSSRNAQIAQHPGPTLSAKTSSSVDASSLSIEIEEGNLVVIRSEGQKLEVLVMSSESSPFGTGRMANGNKTKSAFVGRVGNPSYGEFASAARLDDWLLMLNAAESMAPNPVVAMKE